MPEEMMAELDRNDTNDYEVLNSSGIGRHYRMVSNEDNDDGKESDSNSDDESIFGTENEMNPIGKSEDSDSLEVSKIVSICHKMSIGSNTSGNSMESKPHKKEDNRAWSSSSSEESHVTSDDEESDSDGGLSDDIKKSSREDMIRKLQRGYQNSNYTNNNEDVKNNTQKNDNHAYTKSSHSNNTAVSFTKDTNNADSENESDDGANIIERGPHHKLYHHGGKPYDRGSPRNEQQGNLTPENMYYTDDLAPDNVYFDRLQLQESPAALVEAFPENIAASVENMYNEFPDTLDPVLEMFVPSGDPQINYSNGWPDRSPTIVINSADGSPNRSPQINRWEIQPPMSSASSSNMSDNGEKSPLSYNGEIESSQQEGITTRMDDMIVNNETLSNSNVYDDHCPLPPFGHIRLTPNEDTFTTQIFPGGYDDRINQTTNVYTCLPDFISERSNVQENLNLGQSSSEMQTGSQVQQSSCNSSTFPSYSAIPTLVENSVLSDINNIIQFDTQPTHLIEPDNSITIQDSTSIAIVTVHSNTEAGQSSTNIQSQANLPGIYNDRSTKNSLSNVNRRDRRDAASSVTRNTSATASNILIPEPVTEIHRQSTQRKTSPRSVDPWKLLDLPPVNALERLKERVGDVKTHLVMIKMFGDSVEEFEKQDKMGNTYLMTVLNDSTRLPDRLPRIAPMLSKMKIKPNSLILSNASGHDALYLAAMECPQYDFLTGVLAATIVQTNGLGHFWKRRYNRKNDTLIHAIAAKGDTHAAILKELFSVQQSSRLFDLSIKNDEGKTPLHVAVEAHNPEGTGINSVNIIRLLMEFGADPMIKENNNGNTALHMAISRTSCLGIVQALLYNEGCKATNIGNHNGNTPVHLAANILNTTKEGMGKEVFNRLVAAGGQINLLNRDNKTPIGLLAASRREVIENIVNFTVNQECQYF